MISATLKHVAPMGRIDNAPLVLVLAPVLVGGTTTVVEEGVPEVVNALVTPGVGLGCAVVIGAGSLDPGVDAAPPVLPVVVPVDGGEVCVVEPDVGLGTVLFEPPVMANVGLALPESPITDKANGEDQSEREDRVYSQTTR